MSEITFEVVLLVSNVVLAFREHYFSVTYKGPKTAFHLRHSAGQEFLLSDVSERRRWQHSNRSQIQHASSMLADPKSHARNANSPFYASKNGKCVNKALISGLKHVIFVNIDRGRVKNFNIFLFRSKRML